MICRVSRPAALAGTKGPRMAQSIDFAPGASRLASLLLSYIPAVCGFVAPRRPGASTAIFDRLSLSRAPRRGHSRTASTSSERL